MTRMSSDLDLRRRAFASALLLHAGAALALWLGADPPSVPRPLEVFRLMDWAEVEPASAPVRVAPAAPHTAPGAAPPPLVALTPPTQPPLDAPAPIAPTSVEAPMPVVTAPLAPVPDRHDVVEWATTGETSPAPAVSENVAADVPARVGAAASGLGVAARAGEMDQGMVRMAAPDLPAIPLAHGVNPSPAYPASARRRGIEGEVVLQVWVDAAGLATRLAVHSASGHPGLDRAALEAVARWRFQPARKQGQAVAAIALVPVRFRLTD